MYFSPTATSPILIQLIPFTSSVKNFSIGLGEAPLDILANLSTETIGYLLSIGANYDSTPLVRIALSKSAREKSSISHKLYVLTYGARSEGITGLPVVKFSLIM